MSQRVISFHYTLTNSTGQTIDSSRGDQPLRFLEGVGQIIPGLETHLRTMQTGEKRQIHVKAADAYGERDNSLVLEVERSRLPTRTVSVGDQFRTNQYPTPLTVTKLTDTHVTLDANHPLAGQDLFFDVEITEVRPATAEELAHGHVHGPGGHHH
jgi:FKBP-type peptidyl-prolyl cis-trans isomerase SlyD